MKSFMFALVCLFGLSVPVSAATYYIDTAGNGGSDSNNGSTGSPWLTPNHAVNSGDTIYVKAGNYTTDWKVWGTVTGTDYAHFYCQTFFACNITGDGAGMIVVNSSYWDVEGFNGTSTHDFASCFIASPLASASNISHIMFKNNVTLACLGNGIDVEQGSGGGSVDYFTAEDNIVYNAAASRPNICYSGISIFKPANVDSLSGVHNVIRNNLVVSNVNTYNVAGARCGGTNKDWDGEGINLDTTGSAGLSFTGLTIIENNIVLGSGGACIYIGSLDTAQSISRNNTCYSNTIDIYRPWPLEGDMQAAGSTSRFQSYGNIVKTAAATCCSQWGPFNLYAAFDDNGTARSGWLLDIWDWNVANGVSGNNTGHGGGSYTFGSNNLTADPQFASAAVPGAPNCAGQPDVQHCLRNVDGAGFDVIAHFTPTNGAVIGTCNLFFMAPTNILGTARGNSCTPGAI